VSLYVNRDVEPKLLKVQSGLDQSKSQNIYRTNQVQDFIKQQQNINVELKDFMKDLHHSVHNSKQEQASHFESISSLIMTHQDQYQQLLTKMEKDEVVKKAIMDSLLIQETAANKFSQELENQENLYHELISQLKSQELLFKKIDKKLELQEVFHKTLLESVDNQEAVNFKVLRELENLKSAIFERFSFLIEKMETNYKQFLQFFVGIFKKPDKVVASEKSRDHAYFLTMNQKDVIEKMEDGVKTESEEKIIV
jgi:hypothetical protein